MMPLVGIELVTRVYDVDVPTTWQTLCCLLFAIQLAKLSKGLTALTKKKSEMVLNALRGSGQNHK